ncbi:MULTISPECIES: phosphoenolpyruvate--protein phosphotransferase [unclassified Undibacterium]|uniref:phosphoenolpyruvate--protein phosphotransferase n=1 Tax=unclassified Undibacterium TaxID=2630295 RepID=UPI002AC9DEFD|nr:MULTISPECIES: phosphoenolpyruvate--protein phosphotransferase [unclassified Undibacterium]MEB0138897.1 phosphoenolpyruvate--protein phosphotransferase [Undibacterium sp. CCC2.1]MEB0171772.1 phosphoenolpyruvate--protein phosphotransferase [Undibacterium sp. CCC1.1]MEB0175528.1 phosphoenolpyruvate--protein phosphotransferase [Undibacterium sp. CCC3.4]MEB0214974.1 phosphoenolpyruvate--protein phosphotransferase [Undibacterium sp. 5I2]WPX44955.1 phosphoenolpyruvate--protein phosphotransferase [
MASFTLQGIPVSRGIAIGRAHLLRPAALDVEHYLIAQEQVEAEVLRLQAALAEVHKELQAIWADLPADAPTELGAFIDVHVLILSDPMVSEAPLDIIRSRHYNAEWALVTQVDELSAQFDEIEDEYLRERKADIQQVAERVLKVLTGSAHAVPRAEGIDERSANMIVVARDISPADMMQFRDAAFAGFVTDEGGQNSHTAIVSRSLGIAAVVGMGNASQLIDQDDWLIIDSDAGVVIVAPTSQVLEQYRERQLRLQKQRKKLGKLKKTPAITQDGVEISLLANIEMPEDAALALEAGAAGVGLFRSEFLFMERSGHEHVLPTEEEQFLAYRRAVEGMKGRPVTIRTLDVGGDKPLTANDHSILNPALGLRSIRYCLSEPQLFLTQLRAILRASVFGPVKILIPMMAHSFEVDQTLALIAQAKAALDAEHKPYDRAIPIGAMIEIPAAALALPLFIRKLDFLSIGTNDLIQYTLAIDRADHEVAHLYDDLHPAILLLLQTIVSTAKKAAIPVSICGGMAGDLRLTRLLIGMGFRELSMPAALLPEIKQAILNTNLSVLEPYVKKILRSYEPQLIRETLAAMALAEAESEIAAL